MALLFQMMAPPIGVVTIKLVEKSAKKAIQAIMLYGENWINRMPNDKLKDMTGGYANAVKCLAHYLNSSGMPLKIDFSEMEWKQLLAGTKGKLSYFSKEQKKQVAIERKWSLGKDGWERQGYIDGRMANSDVWDTIGYTMLARRTLGGGKYEYRVEEAYDFINSDAAGKKSYTRKFPTVLAQVGKLLFPNVVSISAVKEEKGYSNLSVSGKWIESVGKPFEIIASMKIDEKGNVYEINGKKVVKL